LLGRFSIGGLAARLGNERSLTAMLAGLGAAMLLWWAFTAWWLLAIFAVVYGTCYGGSVAIFLTLAMDLYGPRALSGIIGALYTGAGLGTLFGPWLAGVAFDVSGSYQLPILAAAVLSFASAAFVPRHEKARHSG